MITIKKGLNVLFAIVQTAIRIVLSYRKASLNGLKPVVKKNKIYYPVLDIHLYKSAYA
jgi:hypothetical protein